MKVLIALVISIVLTIVLAYFVFLPPQTPPDYIYVIILLVFFVLSYFAINLIMRRKSSHDTAPKK